MKTPLEIDASFFRPMIGPDMQWFLTRFSSLEHPMTARRGYCTYSSIRSPSLFSHIHVMICRDVRIDIHYLIFSSPTSSFVAPFFMTSREPTTQKKRNHILCNEDENEKDSCRYASSSAPQSFAGVTPENNARTEAEHERDS